MSGPCDLGGGAVRVPESGPAAPLALPRPTLALCVALVEAWNRDEQLCHISDDLLGEPAVGYVWWTDKVRSWLAQHNILASNALWDGAPNRAINLMRRHGFGDKRRTELPRRSRDSKRLAANRLATRGMAEHREKSARRAWNVCK